MNKILVLLLLLLSFTHIGLAQKSIDFKKVEMCLKKKQKYCDVNTLKLFIKADKAVWKIRNYNGKHRIYITPDGEEMQFYDSIKTIAPTFYTEPLKHKETLVNMLLYSDNLIGLESRLNIIRILYSLCLEEYLDVIAQINENYDSIADNEVILFHLLDQDIYFSGSLKYFYEVEDVKSVLNDIKKSKFAQTVKFFHVGNCIDDILSGKRYKLTKELYEFQYIFKPTRCEKQAGKE